MFKDTIKSSFKELITNRYLTVLSIATLLLAIALVIYIALSVHPRDIQQVTHGTVYGVTHLYVDQWYYLLSFAAFGVITAIIHIALAIKLYISKGHPLALFFGWMAIGIILFAWLVAFRLVNILSAV
jgi:hypothetical protein